MLILGGARSGKSRYAAELALALSAHPVYVATSRPWDEDHRARIERHRRERGPMWRTIEEPTAFSELDLGGEVAVVDCVTLWLTNLFTEVRQDVELALERARTEIDAALTKEETRWLFVSNELGQGLHAETALGRKFTDLQGFTNQYLAARVDAVALMVAGIPFYVKGAPPVKESDT